MEFSVQLAFTHPDRVQAAIAPISRMLLELVDSAAAANAADAAVAADAIEVVDARRTGALVLRTVMYSWFGNRLVDDPRTRITAEETWDFCLHGFRG
jgi:hypothetical protein